MSWEIIIGVGTQCALKVQMVKTAMKKIAIVCLALLGLMLSQMPSQVCAQPMDPSPTPAVIAPTNQSHGATNRYSPSGIAAFRNALSRSTGHGTTNLYSPGEATVRQANPTALAKTAPPPAVRTKKHSIILPGQTLPTALPKDVQSLLRQFQQQSNQLMASLQKTDTDAQRQRVLQDLAQLRDQLQTQLKDMSAQAREQALDMRLQFGGNFAPGNAAGGGAAPSGHGGRPRS